MQARWGCRFVFGQFLSTHLIPRMSRDPVRDIFHSIHLDRFTRGIMSTSRLPWLVRSMHTAGRRVAHPPLGGAGAKGPGGSNIPTPQESVPHPPAPHSEAGPINANTLPPLDPLDPNAATPPSGASASFHNGNSAESSSESTSTTETPRMFNRKGQEIKIRPHRQTSVQLPSGHLEPTSWPPGEEYENSPVAAETQPEHPLWQFFHVSRGAMHKPKSNQQQPPEIGAIETSAPDWTIENDNCECSVALILLSVGVVSFVC